MKVRAGLVVAALCVTLVACGDQSDTVAYGGDAEVEFDEDQAREDARSDLEGTTYADAGAPYGCTEDCSGHEAGFEWAQQNEVSDTTDCGGNSDSFREGCEAYAEALEEAVEEKRDEAQAETELQG